MKKIFIITAFILAFTYISNASDPKFTGIVVSKQFLGVTTDISNAVIYTPDSDGVFRVTAYGQDSTNGGDPFTVSWTDTSSASHSITLNMANNNNHFTGSSLVIRDAASSSITMSVSSISGVTIDLYLTVERIQ